MLSESRSKAGTMLKFTLLVVVALSLLTIHACSPSAKTRVHTSAADASRAVNVGMTREEVHAALGGGPDEERASSYSPTGKQIQYRYPDQTVFIFLEGDRVIKVSSFKIY